MSGEYFDCDQYKITDIADSIGRVVANNNNEKTDEWRNRIGRHLSPLTIDEFKKAIRLLKQAETYVQRIDWLLFGDDDEDPFHQRLKEEIEKLEHERLRLA